MTSLTRLSSIETGQRKNKEAATIERRVRIGLAKAQIAALYADYEQTFAFRQLSALHAGLPPIYVQHVIRGLFTFCIMQR